MTRAMYSILEIGGNNYEFEAIPVLFFALFNMWLHSSLHLFDYMRFGFINSIHAMIHGIHLLLIAFSVN